MGEGKANVGHGGGLAHASLARGDDGNPRGGARELELAVPLEEGPKERGMRQEEECEVGGGGGAGKKFKKGPTKLVL